jgi:hypothetical protein
MRRLIRPSFLTALLLLAAAEIYLHVTLSPLQIAAFRYGHHPDSGFVETTADRVQLAPGPTRDFHAQNFTRLPAPGVCRIFTLGNSVEYWDAVASHVLTNTYPIRLGEELNQHGFPTESLNLGVTGYGLLRNKILLEKILAYQPSLLILKLDVTNEGTDQITAERSREFCSLWPQAWLWKSYIVQSGLIFKEEHLMKHTLPAPVLVRAFGAVAHAASTNAAPFNEVSRQALTECLRLARTHRLPVLLITQTYVTHDTAGRARVTDQGLDAFAATLRGPGVAVFSLTKFLGERPIPETFTDQVHLARPTHQLVAQALAEIVPSLVTNNTLDHFPAR